MLNFIGKKLSIIPKEIFKLTELEEIWLDDNLIEEIPNDIILLNRLRKFSIYKNKLTILPENLFQITSLERLNISANNLTTLSNEIGLLKNL